MRQLFRLGPFYQLSVRRHANTKHQAEDKDENTLEPYQYFLNYTYPPINVFGISTQNLHLVSSRDIKQLSRKIRFAWKDGKINYPLIQRTAKVRMLLLYLMLHYNRQIFLQEASYMTTKFDLKQIDLKYSQLYQQGVLTKWVQVLKDFEMVSDQLQRKDFCIFFEKILKQSNNLRQQMKTICKELDIDWKDRSMLRKITSQMRYRRKAIPAKLFQFMNRVYQYTVYYNSTKKLPANRYKFQRQYLQKVLIHLAQNREDYTPMIKNEVKFFQNVKITTVDYLVTLQFLMSSQPSNINTLTLLQQFLNEQKGESSIEEGRLFQVILLIRILQIVSTKCSLAKEEKTSYENLLQSHIDQLATIMDNITFQQLSHVLSNHLRILQRYLIVRFHNQKTLNRFKQIYYKIFSSILNYEQNGVLLAESSKDVNFIFQAILCLYDQKDEEMVLKMMQKYQRLLLVSPVLKQSKVTLQYRALYMVCLKYDFRSDIFASKLFQKIQSNQLISSQPRNESSQLQAIFDYFIYLNLIETRNEMSALVQRLWASKFNDFISFEIKGQFKTFGKTFWRQKYREVQKNRQGQKNRQVQNKQQQSTPHANLQINQLSLILLMISKTLQSNPSQQVKAMIKNKFESYIKSPEFQPTMRNYIGFPQIYHYLSNITTLLKSKQASKFKQSIDQYIAQNSSQGEVQEYDRVLYQDGILFANSLVPISFDMASKYYGPQYIKKPEKSQEINSTIEQAKTILQILIEHGTTKTSKLDEKSKLRYFEDLVPKNELNQPSMQFRHQKVQQTTQPSTFEKKRKYRKQARTTFFKKDVKAGIKVNQSSVSQSNTQLGQNSKLKEEQQIDEMKKSQRLRKARILGLLRNINQNMKQLNLLRRKAWSQSKSYHPSVSEQQIHELQRIMMRIKNK